ncbi:MAG: response regulator transcription factor [Crocinitomicaceae bacterium]|nr:response regulator transcription factor [Crocinitomicaceae bacterium]
MKKLLKIAIADNHTMFRESLKISLPIIGDYKVSICASDGNELLKDLDSKDVDIVLLDVKLSVMNGWQVLNLISEKYPLMKVIVVSDSYSEQHLVDAFKLGARAYLKKSYSLDVLTTAIQAVQESGYHFDKLSSLAIHNLIMQKNSNTMYFYKAPYTVRELEVLQLICSGFETLEIAKILELGKRTIDTHRGSLLKKSGCKNAVQLLIYTIENKLVSLNFDC